MSSFFLQAPPIPVIINATLAKFELILTTVHPVSNQKLLIVSFFQEFSIVIFRKYSDCLFKCNQLLAFAYVNIAFHGNRRPQH